MKRKNIGVALKARKQSFTRVDNVSRNSLQGVLKQAYIQT
jgi:hypothetical protein